MKKSKSILLSTLSGSALATIISTPVYAHCPLCTGGAAAAAGAAALLGVRYGAIGVFIGAFATAMSLWFPRLVKKQYIPHQNKILFAVIYLSTVLPLYPFMKDYYSVFISLSGDYGSLLYRTYLINWFLVGLPLGSAIMWYSPALSRKISQLRDGKMIRYQGLILTFALLILAGIVMQVLPR